MFEKSPKRIKKSVDFNESVMQRLDEIKVAYIETQKISYSDIVNEVLANTVCMELKEKKHIIEVLEKELSNLRLEYSKCQDINSNYFAEITKQIKQIENIINILRL